MKTRLNNQRPLADRQQRPVLTAEAAQGYAEQMEASLAILREYLGTDDAQGARIWAERLRGAAARLGSWVYYGNNIHAGKLWLGPQGWACRLLRPKRRTCYVRCLSRSRSASRWFTNSKALNVGRESLRQRRPAVARLRFGAGWNVGRNRAAGLPAWESAGTARAVSVICV
jgi:hypothetical protein